MLRSMMRANAVASILFLCFSIYIYTHSPDTTSVDFSSGSDEQTIKRVRQESNIEVLRKMLLFWLEQEAVTRKLNAQDFAALRRIYNQGMAALALFVCLLLASNASALKRLAKAESKLPGRPQDAL